METIDEHVKRLHENCTIVDAHFDLLKNVDIERSFGYRKVIETKYLEDIKKGGVDVIVCSIYISDIYIPDMVLRKALDEVSALYSEIKESPDKIALCTTYEDIVKAKSEKKLAILLSLEGVDPLLNDINLLKIFYKLGVRFVGFTWSRRNFAADGCNFDKNAESNKYGLTDFGFELIKEAEDLGMIIDVSHLNDGGFLDVIKSTSTPVIASHSDCREVSGSMRNLTDEQIKALSSKGGVIGMNVCSDFVSDDENCKDAKHLALHADHIKKLVGVDHVGLGFDFCDFLIPAYDIKPFNASSSPDFDVIAGHKNMGEFTKALINLGYSDSDIELILGGNFMNLYKKMLK